MTATAAALSSYRDSYAALEQGLLRHQPEALGDLRAEAMERFLALGFPTTRQESWRHTNLAALAGTEFAPADYAGAVDPEELPLPPAESGLRAVVIGGRYQPALSSGNGEEVGIRMGSLAAAIDEVPERVLPHLGRVAEFREQTFVALNTALFVDGVFVYVPSGTVLEAPIELVYFSPAEGRASNTHPRTLVVAGVGSQVTVVEHYLGQEDGACFTNAVTEIVAGEGAQIDHVRLQREPTSSFHIATVEIHLQADSRVAPQSFNIGGGLVRNDVNARLDGPGAEVALSGLYLVKGRQHVDNHTRVDHVAPHCTSRENYKGILDGRGRGVFNGRIIVHRDAQKTDAGQQNKNLLLSDKALVNTIPQLEIYADDVKCTHGSTVGQIDEEAIFYFLSRGIDAASARALLIQGFAQEIVDAVRHDGLREQLHGHVADWLADVMTGSPGARYE